ncbi:MAG: alanine racemase [Halothiobacillaceae bacterium]|nr:MAG: alanine racemase [Halothiobacillaceae bacterium]
MHRLGIAPGALQSTYAALAASSNVKQPLRLMSHFASADDLMSGQTAEQLTRFDQLTSALPGEQSLANSAAILAWPQSHRHWVRPGVMLYGVSPFAQRVGTELDLRPVMTLTSRIMAINRYPLGAAIGYGATWVCPEAMAVGVVAIGYGDGYPRHAKVGTPVLIHGRRALIVGRVSMDSICIDLRGHPEALIGDEVILWGEGLPVEEVAQHADTIPYELLCKVTPRTRFRYTA